MTGFVEGVKIEYLYRDGSNYKEYDTLLLAGEWKPEHTARIEATYHEGEWFLPEQVGLNCLVAAIPGSYEDDHPWHEFWGLDDVRYASVPASTRTIEDFVAAMERAAAEGWNQSLCKEIE